MLQKVVPCTLLPGIVAICAMGHQERLVTILMLYQIKEGLPALFYFYVLAGAGGLEPPTPGFGDRCSTN